MKISLLNLPIGIFKIDENKKIFYVNKYVCQMYGCKKQSLIGKNWVETIDPEDKKVFITTLNIQMQNMNACSFELKLRYHEQKEIWVICHLVPELTALNRKIYVGTITDITQLKLRQAALEKLARYDPLTLLPNRYLFDDILDKSLIHAHNNKNFLAVFYLDLDYFKSVNDFFGHEVGDLLLKEAAMRLIQHADNENFVVRLGGDEFAMIISNVLNVSYISLTAQTLIEKFQKPFFINEHVITATISMGISVYPGEETTPETALQHADQALSQAKNAGRNCYKYYNKSMQEKLQRYMLIAQYLRLAVSKNQFELFFQPKIDASKKLLVGIEALIRWNLPEIPHLSPAEFIIISEETNLMSQIGAWVIHEALHCFKEWYYNYAHMKNVSISINISTSQLNDSSLINTLSKALKDTEVPPQNILFELTETAVMKKSFDNNSLLQIFLMELGIGISIDDFGTGYSSFTYLKKLPVKELKIDKSFIDEIGKSKNDEVIIKAIITLAKSLELKVTAEGVETLPQLEFLLENQCNIIQGYYFSQPLNRQAMTKFIETYNFNQ